MCAARAPGDLGGRVPCDRDVEDPGGAPYDLRQVLRRVVVQARREAEPLSERQRHPARAGGGAHEREPWQLQPDRAGRRSFPEDDVEVEILEGRVQHLLDRPWHPVDLVHEQDVALLQVGQDRRQVAGAIERRPGRGLVPRAHLVRDDASERRLAETGRTAEEEVVDALAALAGTVDQEVQLLLHPLLSDELPQGPRTERDVELAVLLRQGVGVDGALCVGSPHQLLLGHQRPTFCRASRRMSSASRPSASMPRIASTASVAVSPSDRSASRTSPIGPSDGSSASPPSFSARSSTTRCATFLPTPGTTVSAAASPFTIARVSAAGRSTDRNASATFGPTPVTPVNRSKRSRWSTAENPYSVIESSRTTIRVCSRVVFPTGGSVAITDVGTSTS